MNLRPRFLQLTLLTFLLAAIPGWFAVRALAEHIVQNWAAWQACNQVHEDRERLLAPLLGDVQRARRLAASPAVRAWAQNPGDPALQRQGLAAVQDMVPQFHASTFVALLRNGDYYHADLAHPQVRLRYKLRPEATKDAWFFDQISKQRDLNINVNPDPVLGVTDIWVNVLIRDRGEVLGIAGAGLSLSSFLSAADHHAPPGSDSLYLNAEGAIQVFHDTSLIDFASISKLPSQRKTIDLLLPRSADRSALRTAMLDLRQRAPGSVVTLPLEVRGARYLAAVTYLPELDWYELSLLNLDVLAPLRQFGGIFAVYLLMWLVTVGMLAWALQRLVLRPLQSLDRAVLELEAGRPAALPTVHSGAGEIRRLSAHFARMAHAVTQTRQDLERQVEDRTWALERMAMADPLTDLLNRRGMTERIQLELQRAQRNGTTLGLLWLDLDWFKRINDTEGHAVGDQALRHVARLIREELRPNDLLARWGGDEFLVVSHPIEPQALRELGERLCRKVAAHHELLGRDGRPVTLSLSIGGHIALAGESLDILLQQGDEALYAAKAAGRNCYRETMCLVT